MAIPVVGFGAGGHAKVVIEILRTDPRGDYELIGLLDSDSELQGRHVLTVPVLGNDTLLDGLIARGVRHFFIGVGGASDTSDRRRLYELAVMRGMHPVSAVHPKAVTAPSAMLGPGITIMAGAILNACVVSGVNVTVNTGAIVEHDCVVGDHVHVATGARIAGGVQIGNNVLIGAGATIRPGVRIGEGAVVGAGAVVVDHVEPWSIVVGVPARPISLRARS